MLRSPPQENDDDDGDDGEGLSTLSKPKSGCLSSEGLTEKVSLQQLFECFENVFENAFL